MSVPLSCVLPPPLAAYHNSFVQNLCLPQLPPNNDSQNVGTVRRVSDTDTLPLLCRSKLAGLTMSNLAPLGVSDFDHARAIMSNVRAALSTHPVTAPSAPVVLPPAPSPPLCSADSTTAGSSNGLNKRVRSLSMEIADPPTHPRPKLLINSKSTSKLPPAVTTPKMRKDSQDRENQRRQKSMSANFKKSSSMQGGIDSLKLDKIRTQVIDAMSYEAAPPTPLQKKVAKKIKQDDMKRARDVKNKEKAERRRSSISMGENDILQHMRYQSAVTDDKTAKEMRDAYGNAAARQESNREGLYSLGREVLDEIKSVVGAARSVIMFVDKKTEELFFFPTAGKCLRFPVTSGIAGWVFSAGMLANIPDAYADSRFNKALDVESGFKTKNILCAPIYYNGNVVAVLQFVNRKKKKMEEEGGFSKEDERAVTVTADRLGSLVGDMLGVIDEK